MSQFMKTDKWREKESEQMCDVIDAGKYKIICVQSYLCKVVKLSPDE